MKKGLLLIMLFQLMVIPSIGHAFFLNFEDGTNGAQVVGIPGVTLVSFNGYNPLYGHVLLYNTYSDDLGIGTGGYHMMGEYFVWAGPNADAQGVKVDFDNNDGTWFKTGYSSYNTFYLEAVFTDSTSETVIGSANYGYPMVYLQINAPAGKYIDYVVLHDTGNYWLVDNMSGDATGIPTQGVPEPTALLFLGLGVLGLMGFKKGKIK